MLLGKLRKIEFTPLAKSMADEVIALANNGTPGLCIDRCEPADIRAMCVRAEGIAATSLDIGLVGFVGSKLSTYVSPRDGITPVTVHYLHNQFVHPDFRGRFGLAHQLLQLAIAFRFAVSDGVFPVTVGGTWVDNVRARGAFRAAGFSDFENTADIHADVRLHAVSRHLTALAARTNNSRSIAVQAFDQRRLLEIARAAVVMMSKPIRMIRHGTTLSFRDPSKGNSQIQAALADLAEMDATSLRRLNLANDGEERTVFHTRSFESFDRSA